MRGFLHFIVTKYRLTFFYLIAILLAGGFAAFTIPQEVNPEIKIPIAVVQTIYTGASPRDMESLVTDKIESELASLEDVDTIESTSAEGVSSIIVNFDAKADLDKSIRSLRDLVEGITDLPIDVVGPTVKEVSLSDTPIVTFSISGSYSEEELKAFGERIEDEVKRVSGISEIILSGVRDQVFSLRLKEEALLAYGVTVEEVLGAVRNNTLNAPLGTLRLEGKQYTLRLNGELRTVEDFASLPIRSSDTGYLRLSQVADVTTSFEERRTLSRVSVGGGESLPSVSLDLFKKTGGNTITIIEKAKQSVERLYGQGVLPKDLRFEVTNDRSEFIREDLSTLLSNGWQTVLLIAIILFLVLGWKEALIAALTIPLVFSISLAGLQALGFTLNSMTLFSLVLSLGLLVDTAIVLMEGFHDAFYHQKLSSVDSALSSIHTFGASVISGTLTTIAAFIPMLLVGGIMGEFLKSIPWTVGITLGASLLVSITINMSLAAFVYLRSTHEEKKRKKPAKVLPFLQTLYTRFLYAVVGKRLNRILVVVVSIVLFLGSLWLPISGTLGVELFPGVNVNYFSISIEAPTGTVLSETDKVVEKVESLLRTHPLVKNYVVTVGSGGASRSASFSGGGSSANSHLASITVNLIPKEQREETSGMIIDALRPELNRVPGATIKVVEEEAGPPSGAPVEVRITGPDLSELERIARLTGEHLRAIPGTFDVEDDVKHGTGEFVLTPDKNRLQDLGLTVRDLSLLLRTAAFQTKIDTVKKDGEDYDILLQYDWSKGEEDNRPRSLEAIQNLRVVGRNGTAVRLSDVADVQLAASYVGISHLDSERIVRVKAQVKDRTPNEVVTELQQRLQKETISSQYTLTYGGETEDTNESFADLFRSMIVGILIIFFILVVQFDSYKQPFIIMCSLPLSLIGVFTGLKLMGIYLSFPAFIGVVSLCGIVVNDAIVLIDQVNVNFRKEGKSLLFSVVDATISRMQPIFLTSITTIIGLLPLSLSDPVWAGLGFAIIYGLLFSTLLTLLVIPVLYVIFEGRAAKKVGRFA